MRCRLKKNICNLPSDGIHRSEIDMQSINYHLPPELQYACRYWTEHLVQSQDPTSALVKAFSVLRVHLLHWLEAMSILGLISEAVRRITTLQPIIQSCEDFQISKFYYDATRVILKNRHMADIAPLQLYSSGLIFCPSDSVTRGIFKNELSKWYQLPRVEEKWNAELQTLEGHSGRVESVTFSPDGRLLASGSGDKTIKLWDPSTGELRQTLEGHSDWVWSVTPHGQAEKNVNISIEDGQWICLQGKRRLWLPSEYRDTCLALKGSRFALGHASGRVSFFSIEL
jgi:WD40 repeat protein